MAIDLKQYKLSQQKNEVLTLEDFLSKASKDNGYILNPAERLLKAIGKPEIINTEDDTRLARLHGKKKLKHYKVFDDFYGLEEPINQIMSYLKHRAQGFEESKQILYLLGPVGGGKSSLAERLKSLMEQQPFYAIKGSPIHESPLGLLRLYPDLNKKLKIPERHIPHAPSPWLLKRIDELEGDISKLRVIKLYPSKIKQIAVAKTEPGDENNQDISALVGKIDIRKLEHFSQDDPDAYRYNGGLCLANRGVLDFVEMFKAPIKMLHPLLTATQEGNYNGTEALSALPFDGIILAHSNESEWAKFKSNKDNEAFLDRIYIVKVPYNLRVQDEQKIYKKHIDESSVNRSPLAPHTLKTLAKFAVLTRLEKPKDESIVVKMNAYDGESVKSKTPRAKVVQQYKKLASNAEGFSGLSTRTAFKLLSKLYNYDDDEIAANPVHLIYLLENYITKEDLPDTVKETWLGYIKDYIIPELREDLERDLQIAALNSYDVYGQNIFNKYIDYADKWLEGEDYYQEASDTLIKYEDLDDELSSYEKLIGLGNPRDFRTEIVRAALRYQSKHKGQQMPWRADARFEEIIQKKLFKAASELIEIIATSKHTSKEQNDKRKEIISSMIDKGYTEKQVIVVADFLNMLKRTG